MRKMRVNVIIISTFILLCVVTGHEMIKIVLRVRHDKFAVVNQIQQAGGERIVLESARALMAHAKSTGTISGNDASLPSAIRALEPRYINLEQNRRFMFITLNTPGRRGSVVVFSEDVPEFGSVMLTNGLWFWNGNPSLETREIYRRAMSR